jgi:hypothetical protein
MTKGRDMKKQEKQRKIEKKTQGRQTMKQQRLKKKNLKVT